MSDRFSWKIDFYMTKSLQKDEIDKAIRTSTTEMKGKRKFINNAKDDADRLKTQATLSKAYQHTLHNNYFQAKDLLLTSHLKKSICRYDSDTQVLYHRTMAHLGLCAFRIANIKEAHDCLVDLITNYQWKELLGPDLLLGEGIIENRHLMPIYMELSLELLECVYLVSAMLLEIPYMAAHEFDARRRMISKPFYQQLRSSERQSFVGPPVSMREHVVAAAKAMRKGNWAACNEFIINVNMNKKVWNLFSNPDVVRAMLTRLIKEETLRVYLFTFSFVYESLSISMLGEMFELEISIVRSIISKMIFEEGLMASFDGPSQTVVVVHPKPSHLEILHSQLTDKIDNLLTSNEREMNTIEQNERKNLGSFRGNRRHKRD